MSYGATVADAVHQADIYAGKILSGAGTRKTPALGATVGYRCIPSAI
jgi:hypothetical protein